ncbi:protein kinase domain-containing protein [Streptomyces sp. NPDC002446]
MGDLIDDRYRVTGILGQGGMGIVHQVRHLGWGADLAVKSPQSKRWNDAGREQFVTEAETWVSLGLHPHVCSCHYVRVLDGVPRVFAEYVPGGSLHDWIHDRRLYNGDHHGVLARMLDVAIQFAWGLDHAHSRGLVHQDVKPANVLMERAGRGAVTAKVTDFGIARARAVALTAAEDDTPSGVSIPVPAGGNTRRYASPEQVERQPLGRRTDVYSYAVSVLEMFTGGATWQAGEVAGEVLAHYRAQAPAMPAAEGPPAMPSDLADLLERCLHHDPARRPGAMSEIAAELAGIYQRALGHPHPRRAPKASDLLADELNNRALSLLDLGRARESDRSFAAAAEADPQHLAAAYNRGLRRWRRADITDENLIATLDGIRAGGDSWQARHLLAQVHLERGDLDSARALLESVRREAPDESDLRAALRAVQSPRGADARCTETSALAWRGEQPLAQPVRLAAEAPLALTGSRDGMVRLWDLDSGSCLRTLTPTVHPDGSVLWGDLDGGTRTEHRRPVLAVDISPDGSVGASLSGGTIQVWDLKAGRGLYTLDVRPSRDRSGAHAGLLDYSAVRISADARVVMWAEDGKVVLWDLRGRGRTVVHEGTRGRGAGIDLTADGRTALFAEGDRLRLWEPASGRGWHTAPISEGIAPGTLHVSADGRFAVTGGYAVGTIRLWDLVNARCVRTLHGHRSGAWALSLSGDARFLLSSGMDRTVRFWDLADGRCLRTFDGETASGHVADVRLARDARQAVSASDDGTVRRWTLPTGSDTAAFQLSRPRPVTELMDLRARVEAQVTEAEAALADGRLPTALGLLTRARATAGYERDPRVLSVWRTLARSSVRTGLRASWPGKTLATGHIQSADLSQDGTVAAICHTDGTVRLWDVESDTELREIGVSPRGAHPVCLRLSADGRRLLSGEDGRVRLWSVDTGACLRTFGEGERGIRSVRFAADDEHALVSRWSYRTQLWDLRTGSVLSTLDNHVDSAAWAGPRDLVAVADGLLHAVLVTDVASGGLVRSIDAPRPQEEARSPQGEGLFFAMLDDLRSPPVRWTAVSLSADGSHLLTGDDTGAIQLWEVATGERLRRFEKEPGHTPATLRFTADGRFALSVGRDFTIRAWDVGTGRCLRVLGEHRQPVDDLVVASDSRRALSWSQVDGARLWELDWELAARETADWDEAAAPYLQGFLARHGQHWTGADTDGLLRILQDAGFGWLRPEGVRARLQRMAAAQGER